MSEDSNDNNLFPPGIALQALSHGSYRTSANALAEIVDNSYDAGAENIHVALICKDGNKPHIIAVLDDGKGMDEHELKRCIQFGYGKQNSEISRRSIGKFGVGLLSASLNQCKHLEVYSWTEGLDKNQVNATNIKIESCTSELPEVTVKPLPDFFDYAFPLLEQESSGPKQHGTMVVWRDLDLDKLSWKKAKTFSKHLKNEVGRIYRNFLRNKKLNIYISIVNQDKQDKDDKDDFNVVVKRESVEPVDPLFLSHWPCPELEQYIKDLKTVKKNPSLYGVDSNQINSALAEKSLFIQYKGSITNEANNADKTPMPLECFVKDENGKEIGSYRILASYRRPYIVRAAAEAGDGPGDRRNPGNTAYGKLAEKLQGVSIMRDGRELTLDTNWLRADSTVDRWIALSIDFDCSLDDLFGVSNDKQMAKSLAGLAQINTSDEDIKEDYNSTVIDAAKLIHKIIGRMRALLDKVESLEPPEPDHEHKRHTDSAFEEISVQIKISKKLQGWQKVIKIDDDLADDK